MREFYRYGTRRFVGYDVHCVPIIDVDNPNNLRNMQGFRFMVDWERRVAQECWAEHGVRDTRYHSRVIPFKEKREKE